MFQPSAKIIADSVNECGDRLTTFVLTYHRFIHSEFMTHRMFSKNSSSCLHGDTLITTDMPSGVNKGKKKSAKYSIRDLYNKWHKGDSKGRCMKSRLKSLSIRCLNEETHEYTHTSLVDVMYSGVKDVFKITLSNGYSLSCSKEHRLFTNQGWQTLESLGLTFHDGILDFPNSSVLLATNSGKPLDKFFDVCSKRIDPKTINKPLPPKDANKLVCRFFPISSVEYLGQEDVYDLEVADPWHNFVANGFVVHNSRAIPVEKMIKLVESQEVYPLHWGKNQKGMVAEQELSVAYQIAARKIWDSAKEEAIAYAKELVEIGVHKQVINRLLEPFSAITVICTGTEYQNFFDQRCHPDAQPEIRALANKMKEAYDASKPKQLKENEWHTPFLYLPDYTDYTDGSLDYPMTELIKVAIGRCARVSYLNHDGVRSIEDDIKLHDRLLTSKPAHLSPFEHVAIALSNSDKYANFTGFQSYRNILERDGCKP